MASPLKGTAEGAPIYKGAGSANFGVNQGPQEDFLGEGTNAMPAAPDAPAAADPGAANHAYNARLATKTANINAQQDRTSGSNFATGAGSASIDPLSYMTDSGKAQMNYMHSLGSPGTVLSGSDLMNQLGEKVGISHAGDAANPNPFAGGITNPFDFASNPGGAMLGGMMDPNKGLGTTVGGVGGAVGGKPITNLSPGTRALAQSMQQSGPGIDDALSQAMGGLGGGKDVGDTSGGDRGGMGLNGAYSPELTGAAAQGAQMQAQGQGVLNGTVAPGGAGAPAQQDALSAAMNFQTGPRQASGVVGDVNNFMQQPGGPSAAELQLQRGAQGNMSDALALARSGRARDAGSQARNLNVAQAQNAATGVDTARDTASLRANEKTAAQAQQLQALGLKGNLAQGLDQGTLSALGLQGDLANQIRSGNVAERGQSLGFDQAQNATGAGLTSDVLKTIPQLENIRHQDQFELTPQQKIAAAKIGAVPGKTTADYVTALLGDTLSAI